ncbi:MAG: GNAT family N-acetyltransferase [Pseudobdellovibrionaceae bacterium]|nr:GNAT family N-acetyltransferase [Bdellovibrionales bacterium]USN46593.1 MAG: GNAT family N-acetyltransferase [Pseudobdellovibrionaceae bacterium]
MNLAKKLAHATTAPLRSRAFVDLRIKLLHLKINKFQPKIRFQIDLGQYLVKTAETVEELHKVLRLRHQVFIEEGLGLNRIGGVDFDRYDLLGDHILLIKKDDNEVIGTYRLVCSLFSNKFYSENEFDLDSFFSVPGVKLELGRACIHPDHRTGAAIHLVWKGMGRYAKLVGADYLFGCTSLYTTNFGEANAVLNSFKPDSYSDEHHIRPIGIYRFQNRNSAIVSAERALELTPPLLRSYINAGAKIYGEPALDEDFNCSDVLTILDMSQLSEKHAKKYVEQGS